MREVKFRAWDVAKKKMLPVSDISFGDDGSARTTVFQTSPKGEYYRGLVHGENGYLMQYTGLQDMHGKEVYEGDILKTEGDRILQIVWYEHGFCWDAIRINIDPPESPIASSELRYLKGINFEIIGNIYETPELLKSRISEVA